MQQVTIAFKSEEDHEYLIKFQSIVEDIIPNNLNIEVVGVVLEVVSVLNKKNSCATLGALSKIILNFLNENENVALYYLCDKDDDIISRMHPRRKGVSPQLYRDMIFSKMFEYAVRHVGKYKYIDKPITINSEGELYYLHLIARDYHCQQLKSIEEILIGLADQMK